MQISLRSHLIAGTAAVVGAGAIAMNPVVGAQLSLPSIAAPSVASVALAGLDSPISELLGTVILGSQYLFNTTSNPLLAASWPYSGMGTIGGIPVFPAALASPTAGGYSQVGLVPQIIADHLPAISQLGINGSQYLAASAAGLAGAGYLLSEGVWNAAGQLLTLNIGGAVSTLIGSISDAGSLALASGAYVAAGVFARAQAVVNYLVSEVPTLIGATVGQVTAVVNSVVQVVTNTVAAIGGGNLEGAFNSVVDGVFGVSGVPGTLLNLTIGAGVQTAPITAFNPGPPASYTPATAFVPSIRTEVQSFVKGIKGALATPNPISPPVASVRKAARSAASVAAPAVAASAGDSSAAAADNSAPAEKPAAHRASRKAARAAS